MHRTCCIAYEACRPGVAVACDNWRAPVGLPHAHYLSSLGKTMRACSYRGIACAGPIIPRVEPACVLTWRGQALEAIKLASGVGRPLSRTLLLLDALAGRFTSVKLRAKVP